MTVVRRVAKAMAAVTSQREAFEAYCKEHYGGFSDESGGAYPHDAYRPSSIRRVSSVRHCSGPHCPNGPRYISGAARPMVRFLGIPRKRRFLKGAEYT